MKSYKVELPQGHRNYPRRVRELVLELYQDQPELPIRQVAEAVGVSVNTAKKYHPKWSDPAETAKRLNRRGLIPEEKEQEIIRLYLEDPTRTYKSIAEEVGVSAPTVGKRIWVYEASTGVSDD